MMRYFVVLITVLFLISCGPSDTNVKDTTSTVPSVNNLDSLDIPTLFSLSEDELKQKNYQKAHHYNDAILVREPGNINAKLLKGRILTDSAAYTDAEKYWIALSAELPSHSGVTYQLGRLYDLTGRKTAALKQYRKVYDLGDTSPYIVNLLSDMYMREGKYQDGISFFQHYLQKNASNTNIRFNLGQCYLFIGQTSNALAQFEYLTVKFPSFSLGYYGTGFAYHGIAMRTKTSKDKSRAITQLEKFLSMEKNKTFYINKAKKMIEELKK